jgi:hypothetical protein
MIECEFSWILLFYIPTADKNLTVAETYSSALMVSS